MFNKNFETIRNPEKEGVVLKIIISRHGPKASAAGEKNLKADYFDKHVRDGFGEMEIPDSEGLVHVSTSSISRAVDSAEIISGQLSETKHRAKDFIAKKKSLETPFQPSEETGNQNYAEDLETIVSIQRKLEPDVRKEIGREFPNLAMEEREAEIRNRIDMEVMGEIFDDYTKENVDEKKFKSSYVDMADNFGKRYLGFLKYLNLLDKMKREGGLQNPAEPFLQIDVSHSFPIAAFLKRYLIFEDGTRADELESKEFFAKTGGIIRESGSFHMDYAVSNGKKMIKVEGEFEKGKKFKGVINLEELTKLIDAKNEKQ